MESSTVVAFRAFVMLACLVLVPLAAIFGSEFSDVVKTVLVEKLLGRTATAKPAAQIEPAKSASPWGQSGTQAAPAVAPTTAEAAPAWPAAAAASTSPASPAMPSVFPNSASSISASSTTSPVGVPAEIHPATVVGGSLASGGSTAVPAVYAAAAEPAANAGLGQFSGGSSPATQTASPADGGSGPVDRFTWIEKRLREYGATHYLLETWGEVGDMYRFRCKMPAPGSSPDVLQFEATHRDALRAMSLVLEQVEAWRAGRKSR